MASKIHLSYLPSSSQSLMPPNCTNKPSKWPQQFVLIITECLEYSAFLEKEKAMIKLHITQVWMSYIQQAKIFDPINYQD